MTAYYNEFEKYPAQWIRNLIVAGLVAPGVVDERSVKDVAPGEVQDATQAHFFAGIAVWSYALRLARVPDDFPVWTGSCPCQPFSQAGKGKGFDDDRHLWPVWFNLIRECGPPLIFFEQVSSPDGLAWLDVVLADLEGAGYTCWAGDLCSAGVGAPHRRQRLYGVAYADLAGLRELWRAGLGGGLGAGFVADPADPRRARRWNGETSDGRGAARVEPRRLRSAGGTMGDTRRARGGRDAGAIPGAEGEGERKTVGGVADEPFAAGDAVGVGDPHHQRPQGRRGGRHGADERIVGAASVAGFWADARWVFCQDGRYRPIGPETECLVDGSAYELDSGGPLAGKSRVGLLKAYGNAVNAQLTAHFVRAFFDFLDEQHP